MPSIDFGDEKTNRFGFDVGNPDINERRLVERDYSIGGGVTMRRTDFDHGFSRGHDLNDRVRGTLGTRRGEHFGKGPKGWAPSDERIHEQASEALYHSHHVDASDIEISVEDGCIYLRGTVESREAKREAEKCVENIIGVDDVMNELRVRPQALL